MALKIPKRSVGCILLQVLRCCCAPQADAGLCASELHASSGPSLFKDGQFGAQEHRMRTMKDSKDSCSLYQMLTARCSCLPRLAQATPSSRASRRPSFEISRQ